jgi:hypothetical protein
VSSVAELRAGVPAALRLIAALEGSVSGDDSTLAVECQHLRAEIRAAPEGDERLVSLLAAVVSIAWFACSELARRDGDDSPHNVAERIGSEFEELLDLVE